MVDRMRRLEMREVKKRAYAEAMVVSVFYALPGFIASVSVVTYAFTLGKDGITAPTLFAAISAFNLLRVALFLYPQVLALYLQYRVSAKRIAAFLALPENPPTAVENRDLGEHAIRMRRATFHWYALVGTCHAMSWHNTPPLRLTRASQAGSRRCEGGRHGATHTE